MDRGGTTVSATLYAVGNVVSNGIFFFLVIISQNLVSVNVVFCENYGLIFMPVLTILWMNLTKAVIGMEIFYLTLQQLLMMFTLIVIGFALRKAKVLPETSDLTMSRLELYVFTPALNFFTQLTQCNPQSLAQNSKLILYGTVVIAVAIAIAVPLSVLFVPRAKGDPERSYLRCIYRYALIYGNYGFIGNFVVLGIWGADGLFKYQLFNFVASLLCQSYGLYLLIPKEKGSNLAKNILKGIFSPPLLAMAAGCIGGLLNIKGYMPLFLSNALENAGACMGPVAMLLAGFVIGGYQFKGLLLNKKVYAASALRLIVLPGLFLTALLLLGIDKEIMQWTLIAFAAPLGLNTIVYPAAYGGETKTGASMTMISTTLSVVTIPLMYYLFIVLL